MNDFDTTDSILYAYHFLKWLLIRSICWSELFDTQRDKNQMVYVISVIP